MSKFKKQHKYVGGISLFALLLDRLTIGHIGYKVRRIYIYYCSDDNFPKKSELGNVFRLSKC